MFKAYNQLSCLQYNNIVVGKKATMSAHTDIHNNQYRFRDRDPYLVTCSEGLLQQPAFEHYSTAPNIAGLSLEGLFFNIQM